MLPKWGSGQIGGEIFETVTLTLILAIPGMKALCRPNLLKNSLVSSVIDHKNLICAKFSLL